ncbi:hypothetical protein DFP72DRAFT_426481 [Ephemerocybe angulata]|uniref:Uncharacterized protein n=1 Tax=Ephemerocybe angulata TaxID=980116 RepID=A0A8H6HUQ9_9AGAR|nr:hypothetical protein DFP72DRAFT_426481 [Tulosesus angulatus]
MIPSHHAVIGVVDSGSEPPLSTSNASPHRLLAQEPWVSTLLVRTMLNVSAEDALAVLEAQPTHVSEDSEYQSMRLLFRYSHFSAKESERLLARVVALNALASGPVPHSNHSCLSDKPFRRGSLCDASGKVRSPITVLPHYFQVHSLCSSDSNQGPTIDTLWTFHLTENHDHQLAVREPFTITLECAGPGMRSSGVQGIPSLFLPASTLCDSLAWESLDGTSPNDAPDLGRLYPNIERVIIDKREFLDQTWRPSVSRCSNTHRLREKCGC